MNILNSSAGKLNRSIISLINKITDWKILHFPAKTELVAVTYANDKHTDGAGAQLQRLYGVYALSRFLGLPYIHSSLSRLDYQGLEALETNAENPEAVSNYNSVFSISSDIELPESYITRDLENIDLGVIAQLEKEAESRGEFILARILYPYGVTDAHPESYQFVKDVSPFTRQSHPSTIRIAMHVRRGELYVVDSDRMLPNEYYISAAQKIRRILDELGLSYVFELHTEVPNKAFTVTPSHHGILNRISDSVVVDPESNRLDDFESLPNLEKFINTDPIETLQRMSTADVLIMSHSSFSYLGGIFNGDGVIIYHKYWHSKLERWLQADDLGEFSKSEFLERLKNDSRPG